MEVDATMQEYGDRDKDREEIESTLSPLPPLSPISKVLVLHIQTDTSPVETTQNSKKFRKHCDLVSCLLHICQLHFLVLIGSVFPILFALCVCYVNSQNVPSTKYVALYILLGNLVVSFNIFGIMSGLYSLKRMMFLLPVTIICCIVYIPITIFVNIVVFIPLISYAACIIIFVTQMLYAWFHLKFNKMWIFWGQAPIYCAVIFLTINDNSIIPAYLDATSIVLRSAITIVFYPVFFYILVMLTEYCAEKLHSDTPYIFTMVAMAIKAFMGRVLNTQLHSYENVVIASVLSVVVRLTIKLFIHYRHRILKTAAKPFYENLADKSYLAPSVIIPELLNSEKAMEIVAIIFSCISIVFFQISRPNGSSALVSRAVILLAIQYGIEIAAEILLIYLEFRFSENIHFKLNSRFVKFFPFSCAVGAALLGTRVVGIYQVLNGDISKYSDTHF